MITKTDYVLIGVGAFAAVLLTSYVPSLMKVMKPSSLYNLQEAKDDYASCPACKEQNNIIPPNIEDYSGHVPFYTPIVEPVSLEQISGIDTTSLKIVRQKGLI